MFKIDTSVFSGLSLAVVCLLPTFTMFGAEGVVDRTPAPPLNLPRLTSNNGAGQPTRLAKSEITVADLSTPSMPGTRGAASYNLIYTIVEAGSSWTHPLRDTRGPTFVSFHAYASVRTQIAVAGASLTIVPGGRPNLAELRVGSADSPGQTIPFGAVRFERHDRATFAALPVLTIRIDANAGTWDLFVFRQLVATDIPLSKYDPLADRKFRLTAGESGAWLLGWVNADKNPLWEDTNGNGIEDAFEIQRHGSLLPVNATPGERADLAREFQQHHRAAIPPAWSLKRPLPLAIP